LAEPSDQQVDAGYFIEAEGETTEVGRTSRKMRFGARKVIRPLPDVSSSAAEVRAAPQVVCRATGTCGVPLDTQRGKR
jgi:3-aminobutyryl-CoA ammonia-lyase